MYCSKCNWDYPTDPDFELTGEGTCPGCGNKYGVIGGRAILGDDGHHETGSDAGESDVLLYDIADDDMF